MERSSTNPFIIMKHISNKSISNIFYHIIRYVIVSVLMFAGISKIIDPQPLIETLKALSISEDIIIISVTILPLIEMSLAVMLLFKFQTRLSLIFTVFLFGSFFAFSIYGNQMGLDKDCGCFGNLVESSFGVGMIIRNLIFLILSILLAFKFREQKEIIV